MKTKLLAVILLSVILVTTNCTDSQHLTITVNGVSFDMVYVEGGTFSMGSNDGDDDEKPVHSVTLSSYHIGRNEVTQKLWKAVEGRLPEEKDDLIDMKFYGDDLPVVCVSWNEAQKFIQDLNSLTGKNFRLPTEAEWEFAARGGIKSRGYKYSGSNDSEEVAWYGENLVKGSTNPVVTKSPNELGIYDMSGNVWEWCEDWYDDYSSSSQTNPRGASQGTCRVNRGGSWVNRVDLCRVACRFDNTPDIRGSFLGFRLAL